ncbi:methyl-accepting chemotaxis protein [Paenibacillus planticolens]|uniref:HAMP domain-containing protein n=1 Tax=Paenibacillus planticolens TaxID=2654976 RepID=A0ABX1ZMZ5_9BACL|nr:methyl-accepting chemotaxis protein [Paenibacillus planticolens]NOV01464.1 HAMP domain-containing protein [Paenibacillus planticolens]
MRFTVKTKMITVFAIIFLMIGGLSFTDMTRMGVLKDTSSDMATNWMIGVQVMDEIHYNSEHILTLFYQKKLEPDTKKHEPFDTEIANSMTRIDKLLENYKGSLSGDDDTTQFDELNKNWDAFKAAFVTNKQIAADPTKAKDAAASQQAMSVAFDTAQKSMAEMVVFNQEGGKQADLDNIQLYEKSLKTSTIVLGVIIVFMIFTCYMLVRNISAPVRRTSQVLTRIANGDLTVEPIVLKNKDEIGDLADSVNQMADHLRYSVQQMLQAAGSVATSSQQLFASSEQNTSASQHVAAAVQEVANGADTQAQNAMECGTAMEEMTIGIQRIAETTSDVSGLSVTAAQIAEEGTHSMERVVHKMQAVSHSVDAANKVIQELEKHSQNIGQISTLIGNIASQTNLLALNAAIEAARAGESGRGFAVVAGEVRKLAAQTDDSVRDISELISNMQRDALRAAGVMNAGLLEVQEGLKEVGSAETAFGQIVAASQEVAGKIQEAAAAAQQMAASSEQVAATVANVGSVAQMTSGTAQSAAAATEEQLASTEEITSSARNLASIAQDLHQVVTKFRIS